MGKGTVIASGLTWEHNYVYGDKNGYGLFSSIAYDDLFAYGLYIGGEKPAVTPNISYGVSLSKVGIFVGDSKERTPLANATVSVNGKSATVDEYGVAQIDLKSGTYEVTVTCDNYYEKEVTLFLKQGGMASVYMTKCDADAKPYIEAAYITTAEQDAIDILSKCIYFTKGEETEVSYKFQSELLGKKVSKYILYQGTTILELTSNKGKIKPGTTFAAEKPIYLQLICTDGTKTEAKKTGIFIKEASSGFIGYDKKASTSFSFGHGVGFTVPGSVPIIGGTKFEYGIDKLPVSIEIKENKVKIAIGFTDFKTEEKAWENYAKKVDEACETAKKLDELSELCKAYGAKSGGFTLKEG